MTYGTFLEPQWHVIWHPDGWAVMREGARRASNVYPTRQEAVERAEELESNQVRGQYKNPYTRRQYRRW